MRTLTLHHRSRNADFLDEFEKIGCTHRMVAQVYYDALQRWVDVYGDPQKDGELPSEAVQRVVERAVNSGMKLVDTLVKAQAQEMSTALTDMENMDADELVAIAAEFGVSDGKGGPTSLVIDQGPMLEQMPAAMTRPEGGKNWREQK